MKHILPLFSIFFFLFMLVFLTFLDPEKASSAPTCSTLTFKGAINPQDKNLPTQLHFILTNPSDTEAYGGVRVGAFTKVNTKSGETASNGELIYTLPINNGTVVAIGNLDKRLAPGITITFQSYAVTGPPITNCNGPFETVVADYNAINDPTRGGADLNLPIAKPAPIDDPTTIPNCAIYRGYRIESVSPLPGNCIVDESTFVVKAQITDVPDIEGGYYYCLRTNPNDCDEDDLRPVGGLYDSSQKTVTFNRLCGDGDRKLKTTCSDSGSDWFHSGKTYRVSLFDKKKAGAYTGKEAAFYIVHYYPTVEKPIIGEYPPLNPSLNIKAVGGGTTDLEIELKGRNLRGRNDNKYNDYFIRLDGYDNDYKSEGVCLFVDPTSGSGKASIRLHPQITDSDGIVRKLAEGQYILKIFDGKDGNFSTTNTRCNENDFVYYYIPVTIGRGDSPGKIGIPIRDPKGKELSVNRVLSAPVSICPAESDRNEFGYCTKIPTALGIKINTEPVLFIRDIFTLVLSIGGIAATILFIQAGYALMTSAGNKEKVGQAREQITASIMGLIFIILSITILEFIGVNILRIPGFGN